MRLFYDKNGNITGTIEGATSEIEAAFGWPGDAVGEITPDAELVARLTDPLDSLHPLDLKLNLDGTLETVTDSI